MSQKTSTSPLSRPVDPMFVVAESKAFVAFDHAIDEQLARLVARWIDSAAPNANRPSQTAREKFGR